MSVRCSSVRDAEAEMSVMPLVVGTELREREAADRIQYCAVFTDAMRVVVGPGEWWLHV